MSLKEPVEMKPTHPQHRCYYMQLLQSLETLFLFGQHVQKLPHSPIFTIQHQLLCLSNTF